MEAINALLDKAAAKCSPSNDSALAARMHVSRSAVSLWRHGGHIKEKHLTALIVLADVDSTTALKVLAEQSESRPEKAVWNDLLKRLGAVAAAVLVTALPLSGKASTRVDFAITGDTAHYVISRA